LKSYFILKTQILDKFLLYFISQQEAGDVVELEEIERDLGF